MSENNRSDRNDDFLDDLSEENAFTNPDGAEPEPADDGREQEDEDYDIYDESDLDDPTDDDADWEAYCRTRHPKRVSRRAGAEPREHKSIFADKKLRIIFIAAAVVTFVVVISCIIIFGIDRQDVPAVGPVDTHQPDTPDVQPQTTAEPQTEQPLTPETPEPEVRLSLLSDVFGYQLGEMTTEDGTLYGLYDRNGNALIEPQYASLLMVDNGHFIVTMPEDGSYSLINIGNAVCASGYTGMTAVASSSGSYVILAFKTSDIYMLSINGTPLADGPCTDIYCPEGFEIMYFKDVNKTLVVCNSDVNITDRYPVEQYSFTDELFVVKEYSYISERNEIIALYGVQDSQGAQAVPTEYSSMLVLSPDRLLAVADPNVYGSTEQAVIYDGDCRVVNDEYAWAEFYFDVYDVLTSGMAFKYEGGSPVYYVIDADGKPLTPPCSSITPNEQGTVYQLVLLNGMQATYTLPGDQPQTAG